MVFNREWKKYVKRIRIHPNDEAKGGSKAHGPEHVLWRLFWTYRRFLSKKRKIGDLQTN